MGKRTLHQIQRPRGIAQAECDDAGKMQRIALVRRNSKDVAQQPFGILVATGLLVLVGDAQYFAEWQRHGARNGRPECGRGCLHHSTV